MLADCDMESEGQLSNETCSREIDSHDWLLKCTVSVLLNIFRYDCTKFRCL